MSKQSGGQNAKQKSASAKKGGKKPAVSSKEKELQDEISRLKSQVVILRSQLDPLAIEKEWQKRAQIAQVELTDQLVEDIKRYECMLKEYEEKTDVTRTQIKDISKKNDVNDKKENSALATEIKKKESEINDLKTKLQNANDSKEKEIDELRKSEKELKESNKKLIEQLSATKANKISVTETENDNREIVEDLKKRLEEKDQQLEDLRIATKELEKWKTDYENMKRVADNTKAELTNRETKYAELENKLSELEKDLKKTEDDVRIKEDMIETLQSSTDGDKALKDTLKSKEEKFKSDIKKLEAEKKTLQSQLDENRKQFTDKENEFKQQKDKIKSLELQLEDKGKQLIDNDKVIKQLNENIQSLEKDMNKEIQGHKESIRTLKAKIAQLEKEAKEKPRSTEKQRGPKDSVANELSEAKEEINELKQRLSKVVGAKLMDDNPNITDLSDENRPTKLSEKYSELYDNEWTDAFEEIENEKGNELETIKHLYKLLLDIFKFCQESAENYARSIKSSVLGFPSDGGRPKSAEIGVTNKRQLKELRKSFSPLVAENIYQQFVKHRKLDLKKKANMDKFIKQGVKICWIMSNQDPPVILDTGNATGAFDGDRFRTYTKTGKNVDYVVWPPMLLHEKGPMLCKGVAQGK